MTTPTDLMSSLRVEIDLEVSRRGADWQTCALVERRQLQKRFWDRDHTPCMQIAMAMRDCAFDVTSGAFDMSNQVMDTP